jgi:NitT/TauT family transport system permease protein
MTRVGAIRLLVIVVAVGLLEAACQFGFISRQTVIPPSEMTTTLVQMLASGEINSDLIRTLTEVVIAVAASIVLGFALGLVVHALPRVRQALDPLLATYYAVPIFIFYPVLIATALRLKLPAAAPHLFTGVKLAVSYGFIAVIASEFILAPAGLGRAIADAYNDFNNRKMYALILLLLVIATVVNMALHAWDMRWSARSGVRPR